MNATINDFELARANIAFDKAWKEAKPLDTPVMYRVKDKTFPDGIDIKDLR